MPQGESTADPRSWLVEAVAALAVSVVIGVWTYQTLVEGEPTMTLTILFLSVSGSAIVFLFGVDKLRAWWSIVSENK